MITLNNVKKIYGKDDNEIVALDNINLSFEPGKLHLIIGTSGSGKSTLLNVMSTLDNVTSGNILIDDVDITKMSSAEKSFFRNTNVGFVFQSYFLEYDYTVLENVCMPLIIRGVNKKEREKEALKIIKKLGLEEKIYKKAKDLSGGERQRVSIARALVGNPKIVFADEPTGNLDTKSGDIVIKILKKIVDEGKTVIVVTHNLEYIKYADNVVKLSDGKIESFKGDLNVI